MAANVKVEIRGLRELAAAFKQVDTALPGKLKANLLGVAENVASKARGKVPRRSGGAAGSIRAKASTRGGSIAFGGSAAEYMPWLNFGGRVGRNNSIVRERVEPDRYIYTTIGAAKDETEDAVEKAIRDAAREANFETKGI